MKSIFFHPVALVHQAAAKATAKVMLVHMYLLSHTMTTTSSTTSTVSGSSIFSTIWGWITSLGSSIVASLGGLFGQIFSGFGQSVVAMFQSFGFSMSAYGVWAPVMFVVGIGAAILVGYLLLDFIDAEKDVTGLEDDL